MKLPKSIGIYAVCGVCLLRALWGLLGGVGAILVGGAAGGGAGVLVAVLGVASIVVAFGQFGAVGGLATGAGWGWTLAVALFGFDAVLGVLQLVAGIGGGGVLIALLIDVSVVGYLLAVKDDFGTSKDRREMVPEHY